jgi:DNA invertase Pin-like site-specific DNA recombinase
MTHNNICKYIRTATNDEKAVEAQRVLLNEFAAELSDGDTSTTLMEFVDKGYSGTSTERPALSDLMQYASSGKVDVVLVTEPTRFERNVDVLKQKLQYFEDFGVMVEFTNTSVILEEEGLDENNELITAITKAMREQDSKARSKRIKEGIKRKKQE